MIEQIQASLEHLKEQKPLVLCLTNYVTMDLMANSLLALGAAPLMCEALEEVEELVTLSHAVYINIGTLNKTFMKRALLSSKIANSLKKPCILDPVGVGASLLRTRAARDLVPTADVIRGNASEILALSFTKGSSKGVESVHSVSNAIASGTLLAHDLGKIVVISGPEDFITSGTKSLTLPFGSPLMPLITGMGCALTAVISAFAGVHKNYYEAAVYATAYFALCGQLASNGSAKPGSFRQLFVDNLFSPDWDKMKRIVDSE